MGCGSSTNTAVVQPLVPGQLKADEDETGSKHSSRGDSAVSKSTTDSGVVMENREVPALPGVVPRKLPPLTSDEASPPLLRRNSATQERQKSKEILEELLNQGIIPLTPSHESSSGAGEAYSIMLNDREGVLRRPPARLESLKANKTQLSKEEIDEKIRLAEERRKLKENELKSRLRAKSARVRAPARRLSTDEDEDRSPLTDKDHIGEPAAPTQGPPAAEEATETLRQAETGGRQSKNTQRQDTEQGKQSGKNDLIIRAQDGELSDSADSNISFQPAAASDEVF